MATLPAGHEQLLRDAVAHYWKTLREQTERQAKKKAQQQGTVDRGRRGGVTGGKQMDKFCELVNKLLISNGMPEAWVYVRADLELPGYFRATKQWDMLIVHETRLVAAIEFKSQRGPSFGNNLNNRAEEALGSAKDLQVAHREGAFGRTQPRPWLGWVTLLEDCAKSTTPVEVQEPHFPVFKEFMGAS